MAKNSLGGVPSHVIRLSLVWTTIKIIIWGDVKAYLDQNAFVLVVCFEFRALMVACGGRHVELSTIFTMAGVDPRWRRMNLFGRR